MSKVLLISPPTPWESYIVQSELYPNLSIILLGTILKNLGHQVKVTHMLADGVTMPKLKEILSQFKPDVVGITMVTFQAKTSREVIGLVKSVDKNIRIAIGGSHPSALGDTALTIFSNADIAVIGEGDLVIGDIADGKIKGGVVHAEPIKDLDSQPFPDLSLTDIRRFSGIYPPGPMPSFNIVGSRGCPFACKFCSRSVSGNRLRFRSPQNIIGEIEHLHKNWGIREFFFQDDTFNVKLKWVTELLELIIAKGLNRGIAYRARCRVDEKLVNLGLLKLMRRAGFWEIFYGVENGNQAMLDRMHKGITVGEIRRAFRLTREAGIKTEASFIIGLPGETPETVTDSVRLWRELKPDWCSFSRAIPFPGTDLEREVRAKGHLLVDNPEDFVLEKTLVRTDGMTGEELEEWATGIGRMVTQDKLGKMLGNPKELGRTVRDILRDKKGIKRGLGKLWDTVRKHEVEITFSGK